MSGLGPSRRVKFGVAVGADEEHLGIAEFPRGELQQEQRGGVGPVQIVEEDDERPLCGGIDEKRGHRFEQAESRLVGVELGRPG